MFVYSLPRSASPVAPRAVGIQPFARVLDRLFDEASERRFGGAKADASIRTPAMDVVENDTSYTVAFDVPGVSREQLKVTIEGRRVSMETAAAAGQPAEAEGGKALYRERGIAQYARTVSLPAEVDQAASQARVENGVLTLTLAKKVPTGALEISVS